MLHNVKTSMYVLMFVSNFSQEDLDQTRHNIAYENKHVNKIEIIAITDL